MAEFRVEYAIDIEADSAQDAAERVAELLAGDGVAQRGSYDVMEHGTRNAVTIDLGAQRGEW